MKKISVQKIVLLSLLMALTTIFKFISIGSGEFRISIFEIPIILAGMISGPLMGAVVAFGGDLIYGLISGYSYSFIMSLSAMIWGIMGGLFYKKEVKIIPLLIMIIITSLITTFNNSIQQYIWYKEGMWARLPIRLIVMTIKMVILPVVIYILSKRVFYKYIKHSVHIIKKKTPVYRKLKRKNRHIV